MFAEACLLTGTSHQSLPTCDWSLALVYHMTFIKSWYWQNMKKKIYIQTLCIVVLSIQYLMCLSVFPQLVIFYFPI